MLRIAQPIRAVGDVGPGPHLRDAVGERGDLTLRAVERIEVAREPVVGDPPVADDVAVDLQNQLAMCRRRQLAIIRNLAAFPKARHVAAVSRDLADVGIARGDVECHLIGGERRPRQAGLARQHVERRGEVLDRAHVQLRVAPLQHAHGLEAVVLQHFDELLVERRAAARRAESAVFGVPAGAPGDLAELRRIEPAIVPAVELAVAGEGDVVDVEVQTHSDGVGRNDVVDVAGLVHVDLGVARARRQGAQHHGGTATLAADPFGNRVDLLRRERDHGGARRQPRDLLLAGEGQLRHAGTGDDVGTGQQRLQRPFHRTGPDEQGLLEAAAVQQTVR